MIRYTYDIDADVAYIYFGDVVVHRTVELTSSFLVDMNEHGQPVGLEVIGLCTLPADAFNVLAADPEMIEAVELIHVMRATMPMWRT